MSKKKSTATPPVVGHPCVFTFWYSWASEWGGKWFGLISSQSPSSQLFPNLEKGVSSVCFSDWWTFDITGASGFEIWICWFSVVLQNYSDPHISPTVSTITTEGYLLNMSSILSFSLLTLVGPIISALGQRALMVCHFLPLMSFPPSNFHLPDHCLHELPAQIPRPFRTSRKREKEKKIKLS